MQQARKRQAEADDQATPTFLEAQTPLEHTFPIENILDTNIEAGLIDIGAAEKLASMESSEETVSEVVQPMLHTFLKYNTLTSAPQMNIEIKF